MQNQTNASNGIILTARIIDQLLGAAPPKTNWLSSTMFPVDRAYHVRGDGEEFLAAHPDFWGQIPEAAEQIGIFKIALEIVDIDDKPADTPAIREAKRAVRARYGRALCASLGPDAFE